MRCAPGLLLLATLVAHPAGTRAQEKFRQREPAKPAPPPAAPVLTRPPRIKTEPRPVYPPEAAAAGLGADVKLRIDIDAEGRVTQAVVVEPAGHGFDEAAVEAALKMEFEPAEVDGKPSPIRIEYLLHFRPALAPAAPAPPAEPPPPPVPPPPPPQTLVRGLVREKGTRDPIAAADVFLTRLSVPGDPGRAVASSAADGRFEVVDTPGGRARLVVASSDHEPCLHEVTLPDPGGAPLEIVCVAARRGGASYETVVEAPARGEEVVRHTLRQAELTTVPGTFGDPLRVLQNLPGIARAPYGVGLLIIRGSSPQDSGVYVDGHRVPLLYHFLGGPSVLTPDLIERIDFYPGGFGVRYGRAIAGVVDVGTRSDRVTRLHGSADIDFLDSSAYVEGPLGEGGTSGGLAARRSYVDALLPFVIPEREGSASVVVTPVYWDYQGRVSHELGKHGRLSLFAFGSEDSLRVIAQDPSRGDLDLGTRIGFHRVIGSWATTFGPWSSRLSPSYGFDRGSFRSGQLGGEAYAHVLGLRHDLERPLGSRLRLAVGLDGELRFDTLDVDVPLPLERRTYGRTARPPVDVARGLANSAAGVYLEALWDVRPDLRIVPGVRADWFHVSAADRASLDPRLVVRWTRRPSQAFTLGAGLFHQAPLPQQLDAQVGNPDLGLIWSDQYHAGIEQGLARAVSLDATLYYLRRHALPIASSRTLPDGRLERLAGEGRGRGYGLELRLRHAVTEKLFGWISYTLSRAEAISTPPVDGAPEPPWRPTDFDQAHNFILVASRRLGAWELGTRLRLVTGIPDTPIAGGTYDADFDEYEPVSGPARSIRRATFHQLDLRAERTFTFDAWQFSTYLDVQNVYNAENPEATIHDFRYRKSAPVRGLPILPVIGLRGRF